MATIGAFILALLGFLGISNIEELGGGSADAGSDADAAVCDKAFAALETRHESVSTGLAPAYWAYAQALESAALNAENDELSMYFENDAAASRQLGDAWGRLEGYLIDPAVQTQRQIDQDSWVAMCTEIDGG